MFIVNHTRTLLHLLLPLHRKLTLLDFNLMSSSNLFTPTREVVYYKCIKTNLHIYFAFTNIVLSFTVIFDCSLYTETEWAIPSDT